MKDDLDKEDGCMLKYGIRNGCAHSKKWTNQCAHFCHNPNFQRFTKTKLWEEYKKGLEGESPPLEAK